jgi:uncharacterized membrane protein YedE/YeeE
MGPIISSLVVGTIFGIGLTVSQMIDPAKVIGFLDLFGNWDPTLAVVMAGALAVSAPGYYLARKLGAPVLAARFEIPTRRDIDARLVGGAALFGIGWGLAGFCPGPALSALATGLIPVAIFVASMIAGMWLHRLVPPPP